MFIVAMYSHEIGKTPVPCRCKASTRLNNAHMSEQSDDHESQSTYELHVVNQSTDFACGKA